MARFDIPQFNGDYENFKTNIQKFKDMYNSYNSDLINSTNTKINIYDLTDVPDGRLSFDIDDVNFECLFIKGNYKKLYVVLSGGIGPDAVLPHFERWSFNNVFEGTCLYIEDPMYKHYMDVALYTGWFYGHGKVSYLESVRKIVSQFSKYLDIDDQGIIYYGSSSGGYAALYLSSMTQNSKCVAINPQINLKLPTILEWPNAIHTQKVIGADFTSNDIRNDLRPLLAESKAKRTVILINSLSQMDMMQCKGLCEFLNVSSPSYGLNKPKDNLFLWLYEAVRYNCEPHTVQENKLLMYSILNLLETEIEDFEKISKLYLSVTMLWAELYQQTFHTVFWMKKSDELKAELKKLSGNDSV